MQRLESTLGMEQREGELDSEHSPLMRTEKYSNDGDNECAGSNDGVQRQLQLELENTNDDDSINGKDNAKADQEGYDGEDADADDVKNVYPRQIEIWNIIEILLKYHRNMF